MRALRGIALAGLLGGAGLAQEKLSVSGPEPATLRLGDTARIVLTVEGRGADPKPPAVADVDGLEIRVSAPSTRMFQSWDGRNATTHYSVQFTLYLTPTRDGVFTIPPIRIWTGTREQQTKPLQLEVVKDMKGEEFGYLEVRVQSERVYVHEPIRIRVEFGVDRGLRPVLDVVPNTRQRYIDYEVQAPWLSEMEGAVSLPVEDPPNGRIVVCNRTTQMADFDPDHERRGRRYNSFVFERAFLPTRIGRIELTAPMLRYDVLLREGRVGFFGETVGSETRNYYVYGKPLAIDVLPIPEEGRPEPFYGAVGRFEIDASLDRDDVELGASVKLKFSIRGQGNMEFLRVPPLESLPGLHKLGQTEKRTQDSVEVTYDLAPIEMSVREVPSIEWNYFDTTPGVESFKTVRTKPLALHVRPLPEGQTLPPLSGSEHESVTPGVDDIADLRDLEPGGEILAADAPLWLSWLSLLLPWGLVLGFAWLRSSIARSREDVAGRRARTAAKAFARALGAGADPAAALSAYLGDRLGLPPSAMIGPDARERLSRTGLPADLVERSCLAIESGIEARYGGGGGIREDEARALVSELERCFRRPRSVPLLVLAMMLIPSLAAQAQDASAGVEAYRRGDYEAAARCFERAIAGSKDRRLYYDLGNCRYRQQDYAGALWAYECARLGMPRDPDLLANIRLCREKLRLAGGEEPFLEALRALLRSFAERELIWIGAALHLLAAAFLIFGRRSLPGRVTGAFLMVPAAALSLELLWFAPARPPLAIAARRIEMTGEPRKGSPVIATVDPGVELAFLGDSLPGYVRVLAGTRRGYAPAGSVLVVR
ncbi:MAG: hypothetical protein Fur0037_15490 [Planctomycetota bacterium]